MNGSLLPSLIKQEKFLSSVLLEKLYNAQSRRDTIMYSIVKGTNLAFI